MSKSESELSEHSQEPDILVLSETESEGEYSQDPDADDNNSQEPDNLVLSETESESQGEYSQDPDADDNNSMWLACIDPHEEK